MQNGAMKRRLDWIANEAAWRLWPPGKYGQRVLMRLAALVVPLTPPEAPPLTCVA